MDTPAPLPCVMLWIGDRLSVVERACMRSVLRCGHPLTLYVYDAVAGVPEGVVVADAETILPRSAIVTHRSGSVALFSDWFRFELQRRGAGIWLDADVYLLEPLAIASHGNLFGWYHSDQIGAGILRLPPDSPIIAPILELFRSPAVPDWLRWPDRMRARLRSIVCGSVDLGELPWGVAGPIALTALARRSGLAHLARPREEFYSYDYRQAEWIFDPARSLEEFVRPSTRALHLGNYIIAERKEEAPTPGSFFDHLSREAR